MVAKLGRPAAWIAFGALIALALRAPWLHAPLTRDEGGDAFVATSWHHGPFAYGSYFLDRPPLLLLLYRLAAGAARDAGVRLLGAIAAVATVVLSTLLAVRVAGRAAAPWAALMSALLASSYALWSVYTPAELLAVVPSAASGVLLFTALERERVSPWLLVGAGALAATALLVKQSFADPLVAGVVGVAAMRAGRPRRLGGAAAYATGAAGIALAVLAWATFARVPLGAIWDAMFEFRVDATSALAADGPLSRLGSMALAALASGLAPALLLAAAGVWTLRARRPTSLALAAWIGAGLGGILLGGSYWPHYLIELVPATVAGAAVALSARPRLAPVAACAVAVPALAVAGVAVERGQPDASNREAAAVGGYVRDRALPGETMWVRYAHANVLWYARHPSPWPYEWSLMMQAVQGAQSRLARLLASPHRPTWVVTWQRDSAFGLDRSGLLRRVLARHYRRVATVCGRPILLADGAPARPAPRGALHCN